MDTNEPQLKNLPIGEISSGTLRPEDLIESFAYALETVAPDHPLVAGCGSHDPDGWDWVDELIDALNEHCPSYCWFGAHEGDGALFGVWPDLELLAEDAYRLSDPEELDDLTDPDIDAELDDLTDPDIDAAYFVNDHGNTTCYVRDESGRWVVEWETV